MQMLRDPTTVIHAEDLQAGSSYNIPKLTQQTFGTLRAADEIIDEGHFIGKALGEGIRHYESGSHYYTGLDCEYL
jgi:pyruvate/2-oxoglutarate/acetoin dehydrogenase E1 component